MRDYMTEMEISNQFVTFSIEDEMYAINVFKSREIIEVPDITKVPGMPDMIRGVINVRGEVIPVIDLKVMFGNEKTLFQRETVIIITEMQSGKEVIPIGLIVDAAQKVITIEKDHIEKPPRIKTFIGKQIYLRYWQVG